MTKLAKQMIECIAEGFYNIDGHSLDDIKSAIKNGDKPNVAHDVMLTPDEVWPHREFTRSETNGRRSPAEWEDMKRKMKEGGWDPRNPLCLMVDNKGDALVVDGNHRLAIAREVGLESIPVKLSFVQDLTKAGRE